MDIPPLDRPPPLDPVPPPKNFIFNATSHDASPEPRPPRRAEGNDRQNERIVTRRPRRRRSFTSDDDSVSRRNSVVIRESVSSARSISSAGMSEPEGGRPILASKMDPVVTWLDFHHFKNRKSDTDGLSIIEVLTGHPLIHQEVLSETRGRRGGGSGKPWDQGPPPAIDSGDQVWIQRIRLQSPPLICLLSRLSGRGDRWPYYSPRVFFLPFRLFFYYLPQMKECLKILEERWGAAEEGDEDNKDEANADEASDVYEAHQRPEARRVYDEGHREPALVVTGPVANSRTALIHVRCYVNFVEKHIMPRWERAAGTSQTMVRFQDLYMFFKEGELIYLPQDASPLLCRHTNKKEHAKMSQRVWRVYSLSLDAVRGSYPDDTYVSQRRELHVFLYYIDYDGSSYVPIRHEISIKDYEGEEDITRMPIVPMRYVRDAEKMTAGLKEQGKWFQQVIKQRHLYHDGWTVTHGPTGHHAAPEPTAIEHIQGDVMIDFVEGYKSGPSIEPGPQTWTKGVFRFNDLDWSAGKDLLRILYPPKPGVDPDAKNLTLEQIRNQITETCQNAEWYRQMLTDSIVEKKEILRAYVNDKRVTEVEDDDIVLLPSRVVAYSLRERKFVMLAIDALRLVPPARNVFKDLKIDPEHKRMVRSLVKSHLQKQTAQRARPTATLDQDLIRGKGSGLVILLHGVPGVGKTATAEAVAQANGKPLFVITCGDLGFTAKEVETALRDIFRLAHHWDCILLLDEADIFLSRREMSDLKRNALVSVFLRVLEYYSGILFLTTNRVGTLDEAFKSRIHVSLYYPPLSIDQTMAIFDVNIRRLEEIETERQEAHAKLGDDAPKRAPVNLDRDSILHYAEWHYFAHTDTPEQRWNGRQIRNAFQIAHSLAHYDMQGSGDAWADGDDDDDEEGETIDAISKADGGSAKPEGPVHLSYVQFEKVANAIEKFEDYLYHATAGTDTDRARLSRTRADDYNPQRKPETPTYRPLRYQPRHDYVPPDRRGPPPRGSAPPPQRSQFQPPRGGQTPDRRPPSSRHGASGGPQRGGLNPGSGPYGKSPSPTPRRGPPRSQPSGSRVEESQNSGWEAGGWENNAPAVSQVPRSVERENDNYFGEEAGQDEGYEGYDDEPRSSYYREDQGGHHGRDRDEQQGWRTEYRG
ncbi:hypothetical protein F5X68DRAFT_11932 [Plectosphaerella plurivora]|uniref:AAA+ ATPase domain-containing protein n=1 Tax=Plectosphaerella plurivora TaxID=936078 RepID=A0A9P8VAH0_9PEZI|nr:hypothetical protein F5X68DRAFT_11932 [Plectosphaerella plurivora]